MSAFLKTLALAACVATGVGTAAQAVTVDNGLIGANGLEEGSTESSKVLLIREATGVTVADIVRVDYLLGANLNIGVSVKGIDRATSTQSLEAGTYNSYMLHFDSDGRGSTEQTIQLADNERIRALIVSNNGEGKLLNLSDDTFGLSGLDYASEVGRRTEASDTITLLSENSILFNTRTNATNIDNIRVITTVVPLPAGAALMLTGLFAFGALRRKG